MSEKIEHVGTGLIEFSLGMGSATTIIPVENIAYFSIHSPSYHGPDVDEVIIDIMGINNPHRSQEIFQGAGIGKKFTKALKAARADSTVQKKFIVVQS